MADSRVALVLDDDPLARLVIVRALAALPNTAVVGVGTVAEARQVVASERIAIAVLDLQLPDGNGLEVLELLRSQERFPCVVLASAFLHKFRPQVQLEDRVTLMDKPVDPDELRAVLEAQADPERAEVNPFSVPEYLQIACMGLHSLRLQVVRDAIELGTIVIQGGEIWTAVDERGRGEDAFRRLIEHQAVEVRCRPLTEQTEEREINGNWQQLLLNAARQNDEDARNGSGLGEELSFDDGDWSFFDDDVAADEPTTEASAPTPGAEPQGQGSGSFEECMEMARRLVISSQLQEAYSVYSQALRLRPNSRLAQSNLSRLRKLGFGA